MSRAEEFNEEQWAVIEDLFPELQPRENARGRPSADRRPHAPNKMVVALANKIDRAAWTVLTKPGTSHERIDPRFAT
jgi:hypothetical protein